MSGNNPAPQPGKPAATPRNPVEKILVRGLMVVLLVLVGIEGYSRMTYAKAFSALQAKMKAVDDASDSPAVTEADVKRAVGGKQCSKTEDLRGKGIANGASRLDVYSWFTLSPSKRELYVYYGHAGEKDTLGPEVLAVQSDDQFPAPPEPTAEQREEMAKAQASGGGAPGMMGPGMMGGPPGGARGGPPGAHSGRPGGGKKAAAEGDKPEGDTPDGEKSATEEPASGEKPADTDPKDTDADKDQ